MSSAASAKERKGISKNILLFGLPILVALLGVGSVAFLSATGRLKLFGPRIIGQIVHLSDLQIPTDQNGVPKFDWDISSPPLKTTQDVVQQILTELPQEAHVVLTGDITDSGGRHQYASAYWALKPLMDAGRLTVVPGNHDDLWVRELLCQFRDEYCDTGGKKQFNATFADAYPGRAVSFPFVKHLNKHIVLIGLDSTMLAHDAVTGLKTPGFVQSIVGRLISGKNPIEEMLAQGAIGPVQLMKLKTILDSPEVAGKFRIVLLHHAPLDRAGLVDQTGPMALLDAKHLLGVLKGRCDLVLFGHRHQTYFVPAAVPCPMMVAADSVSKNLNYRVLTIYSDHHVEMAWHSLPYSTYRIPPGDTADMVQSVECLAAAE